MEEVGLATVEREKDVQVQQLDLMYPRPLGSGHGKHGGVVGHVFGSFCSSEHEDRSITFKYQ